MVRRIRSIPAANAADAGGGHLKTGSRSRMSCPSMLIVVISRRAWL